MITADTVIDAAGDVDITAVSTVDVTALAEAQEADKNADLNATLAFSSIDSDAIAKIGGSTELSVGGELIVKADNLVSVATTADGKPAGTDASGGSVAYVDIDVETHALIEDDATIDISNVSPTSIAVDANTTLTVDTQSIASAGGATANGGTARPGATGDAGASAQSTDAAVAQGGATPDGDLQVTAALSLNTIDAETIARIDSTNVIETTGLLEVSAEESLAITAKADGSSVEAGATGVGVGVAINNAAIKTLASIESETRSNGVTVEAKTITPADKGAFVATSMSGAGAANVGVAGSFARNDAAVDTAAFIAGAGHVDAGGGDVKILVESQIRAATQAKAGIGFPRLRRCRRLGGVGVYRCFG